MGGPGSGSFPDDGSAHRGGRKKRAAVAVAGSGYPVCPADMPDDVREHWERFAERVSGIAFSQDSEVMEQIAWDLWQLQQFRKAIHEDPLNEALTRTAKAIWRPLAPLLRDFAGTPRARQILLVPKEEEEKDEFEKLMEGA